MRLFATSLFALACAGASFTAAAQSAGVKAMNGVLVDARGMTVYTFDKDAANSGKSACNGPCAKLWPPVAPMGTPAAPYSTVTREDGSAQLAYEGKPLYVYDQDKKAGDRGGDNFKDVWHVVKQ
jgi:predicted lipoprotein with Yx(FWY)xxD motif